MIFTKALPLVLIMAVRSSTAAASNNKQQRYHNQIELEGYLDELPTTGREWMTLENGVEFQPSEDFDFNYDLLHETADHHHRHLKQRATYDSQFVDGAGAYYNDYAQAWRLLGFYIDCNAPFNNVNECYGDYEQNDGHDQNEAACQRFLLWAAYVDLDYAGGGIGEYQFYDRKAQQWNTKSCVAGNGRCAKMDCHLKESNFKLLGFFKEPNYHEWMEQLFKHQGVCLWTDQEYSFMQTDRYLWPCTCSSTGQKDEDGNSLFYDTKPMPEGRIGLGLYTDSRCKYDYLGEMDIMQVLESGGGDKNKYGSVSALTKGLEAWNSAFDAFKVCQPCKAYNLGYNSDLKEGGRHGGDDDAGYSFDCYDDADYVNVNQCMKFKTKTEMIAADFRDLMMAHEQGHIVEFEVMDKTYGYGGYRTNRGTMIHEKFSIIEAGGIPTQTILFFTFSLVFLMAALILYVRVLRCRRLGSRKNLKVPLMNS